MLEKTLEGYLASRVRMFGGQCYKFLSTVRGVPDRLILMDGRAIFVELKTAEGRLSKAQAKMFRTFESVGFPVLVIRHKREVDELVYELYTARVPEDGHRLDPVKGEVRAVPGHGAGQDGLCADGDR